MEFRLAFPLCLTLRLFVVGLAWGWPLRSFPERAGTRWAGYLATGTDTLLAGLVLNILAVLVLGEAGFYGSRLLEAAVLGAIVLAGFWYGWVRDSRALKEQIVGSVPLAAVFALGLAVVAGLAPRSEWILGGWDPGVYLNEGVSLEKRGTFHPPDPVFSEGLTPGEQAAFTRTGAHRTERFPGVAVDAARGAFGFEFFRLTPSVVAFLHRCGGLRAALLVNAVLGFLVVVVFLTLVIRASGGPHAVFSVLVLVTQPIWLYHTHTPVSEMLGLLLILTLGLLLLSRGRGLCSTALIPLLLLMLVLNRFGFVLFAGIFLLVTAGMDAVRPDRGAVWRERGIQIAAVLAGAMIDFWIAPVTLRGWVALPLLLRVSALCLGGVLLIDVLSTSPGVRERIARLPSWLGWILMACSVTALGVMYFFGRFIASGRDADNVYRLVSYAGVMPVIMAVTGGVLFLRPGGKANRVLRGFVLFLLAVTAVVLTRKYVVDIYPWATRRYLPHTVPAVAVLAGYPLALLWEKRGRRRALTRASALVLCAALLFGTAAGSWHAWSRTEFQGVSAALSRVADRIGAADIVIVDSPRWGTPLAFIFGKQVFNGKHFWRRGDTAEIARGLGALARLRGEGKRIRFLTTTPAGLEIFPFRVEPVTLDWQTEELTLEEIDHSPRATDFVLREKRYLFRLYTWQGT